MTKATKNSTRQQKNTLYVIRFVVCLEMKYGMKIEHSVETLPFIIWTTTTTNTNNSKMENQAFLLRIFGNASIFDDEPMTMLTSHRLMIDALEMRFKDVGAMPPKQTQTLQEYALQGFCPEIEGHLLKQLGVRDDGQVDATNFIRLSEAQRANGDPVPFYEWFFALPKLIGKRQSPFEYEFWKRGLIWYCSKERAEELLKGRTGTFMVRVSDTEAETFKLSSLRLGKNDILKWENDNNFRAVDFMAEMKEIDPNKWKELNSRPKEYAPANRMACSNGARNESYFRNQKPFGADSYLRFKWFSKKRGN